MIKRAREHLTFPIGEVRYEFSYDDELIGITRTEEVYGSALTTGITLDREAWDKMVDYVCLGTERKEES